MEFGLFKRAGARIVSPRTTVYHVILSDGDTVAPSSIHDVHAIGQGTPPTLHIRKNVYRLGDLFFTGSIPVLSEALALQLLGMGEVELQPVHFAEPYWIPNEPETDIAPGFLNETIVELGDMMANAARRFACKPPDRRYYAIIPHRSGCEMKDWERDDEVTLQVGSEYIVPSTFSVNLSEAWLDRYGMYHSGVIVCRMDIFRMLKPYFPYPYIWSGVLER